MIKGLKFLNIFLMLLIFPISSLIIRGYLIYKYNPQEKEVIKSSTAVYKPVQNNIQSYASIIVPLRYRLPWLTSFPLSTFSPEISLFKSIRVSLLCEEGNISFSIIDA